MQSVVGTLTPLRHNSPIEHCVSALIGDVLAQLRDVVGGTVPSNASKAKSDREDILQTVFSKFVCQFQDAVRIQTEFNAQLGLLPDLLRSYLHLQTDGLHKQQQQKDTFSRFPLPLSSSSAALTKSPRDQITLGRDEGAEMLKSAGDQRIYVCEEWDVDPKIQFIDRFKWNPHVIDDIWKRLQIFDHRRTIPKVTDTRSSDSGIYVCVATNEAGTDQQAFTLEVLVPPKLVSDTSVQVAVSEGGTTTLECKSRGYPAPQVIWSVESRNSPHFHPIATILKRNVQYELSEDGQTLQLFGLSHESTRHFRCSAINNAPVLKPPSISPERDQIEVESGQMAFSSTVPYAKGLVFLPAFLILFDSIVQHVQQRVRTHRNNGRVAADDGKRKRPTPIPEASGSQESSLRQMTKVPEAVASKAMLQQQQQRNGGGGNGGHYRNGARVGKAPAEQSNVTDRPMLDRFNSVDESEGTEMAPKRSLKSMVNIPSTEEEAADGTDAPQKAAAATAHNGGERKD